MKREVKRQLMSTARQAAAFFFPTGPRCPVCAQPALTGGLCRKCLVGLPLVVPPVCTVCGKPLRLTDDRFCADCRKRPHFFALHRAAGVYEGPLRELIHAFKYQQERALASALAQLMVKAFRRWVRSADLIVPVPLHPLRLRRRGFNQAELLAVDLAREIDLRIVSPISRRKETRFQSGLSALERRENLRDAFRVDRADVIRGKRVLVVDDIYTTGSTLDAMARCLLRSGAGSVFGLSVAVGIRDLDWGIAPEPRVEEEKGWPGRNA